MTSTEFKNQKKDTLDKPVTLGVLFEFTDEILMPRMTEMMDEKIGALDKKIDTLEGKLMGEMGKLNHDLKVYIDQKLADYTSDIFKRLDERYRKDKEFKETVISILKRNNLATGEELGLLQGLAS